MISKHLMSPQIVRISQVETKETIGPPTKSKNSCKIYLSCLVDEKGYHCRRIELNSVPFANKKIATVLLIGVAILSFAFKHRIELNYDDIPMLNSKIEQIV
jgi:hypothetical protein